MQIRYVNEDAIKNIGFKKELSNVELYGIRGIITELNKDEIFHYTVENFEYTVEDLSLVYTSSSAYGMYSVCGDCWLADNAWMGDDYAISHFGILNDGKLVLVVHDDFGNERYYLID